MLKTPAIELTTPPTVLPAVVLPPPAADRTLTHWVSAYVNACVEGANVNTAGAKRRDLERFVAWFLPVLGDGVDAWAPPVTKAFQAWLVADRPGGAGLAASSANRVVATVRHFGKWLHTRRAFQSGEPCADVRDIVVDRPEWRGLDETARLRLASGVSARLNSCTRKDQNPLLEAAVFYVLLRTGLRVSELVALELSQYDGKRFADVWRKNKRQQASVPVPPAAREWLDRYLDDEQRGRGRKPGPLFVSARSGRRRLDRRDVQRLLARIARQASAQLPDAERMHLHPHQLRHNADSRIMPTWCAGHRWRQMATVPDAA